MESASAQVATEYCLFWCSNTWWLCLTKSEWASWVQAIGTVAAVLAAGLLAWWESRQRRKASRAEAAAHIYARAQLVDLADGALNSYLREEKRGRPYDSPAIADAYRGLELAIADVLKIELVEMPSREAVLHLRDVQQLLRLVLREIPAHAREYPAPHEVDELEELHRRIGEHGKCLWNAADKMAG